MTDYTIAIYCFIDDFLKKTGYKENPIKKITDAELMTTALVAARYFSGNHQKSMSYMRNHHGVDMIDKSGFNRRLHGLSMQLNALFIGLGSTLKELNTESKYLIDSFPVSVCRNVRIPRNRILKQEAYRGRNASKREYFYGFKVQVITTVEGIPVEYFISAGSFADITAFQAMNIDLPEGSELYGDSGYTDYGLEDFYKECENIQLLIERKSNSKRGDSPALAFIKKQLRKRIETTFSEITAFFPLKIHAVTPEGFLLKVFLFLFAYTLKRVEA
ncbi:IS982 family transposase [uncultured Microscilla sp.]|uniref:IS982 family transposase n=1 Tax=uncultured Microscilla sp. TaxID=432653 RepID=UPI002602BB2D|nr:IS982 family transposase [uncultured Microscilla sp.]